MKKLFLLAAILFVASAYAQKEKHILSYEGMDELSLGMSKSSLEQLLKKKIVLKHIGIDERYTETINATYRGIPFELHLMRSEEHIARLEGISTRSALYKTQEGIGIGSTQEEIINTYEQHLLIVGPESITLANIGSLRESIVFTMEKNKVVMISVEPTAAFRDRE